MCIAVRDDAHVAKERFLLPGEWHFGSGGRIRTLLGSCVAVTFWHPALRMGGMCHFVLPTSGGAPSRDLDGRYGDQAVALMVAAAQRTTPRLLEYRVGLYGGGRMFDGLPREDVHDVGQRNIEAAHRLLAQHGLLISDRHCGGPGHRNIALDLDNGAVCVRHSQLTPSRERR